MTKIPDEIADDIIGIIRAFGNALENHVILQTYKAVYTDSQLQKGCPLLGRQFESWNDREGRIADAQPGLLNDRFGSQPDQLPHDALASRQFLLG